MKKIFASLPPLPVNFKTSIQPSEPPFFSQKQTTDMNSFSPSMTTIFIHKKL